MNYSDLKHILGTSVKKKNVLNLIDMMKAELSDDNYFRVIIDLASRTPSKDNGPARRLSNRVPKAVTVKSTGNSWAKSVYKWSKDWQKTLDDVYNLIDKTFPKTIVLSQGTVRQMYLLMIVYMFRNVLDYTYVLATELGKEIHNGMVDETVEGNQPNKFSIRYLEEAHDDYIKTIDVITAKVKKIHNKLPNTVINEKTEEMIASGSTGLIVNSGAKVQSGFIGGLIYPVQLIFTDLGVYLVKRRMVRKRQLEIILADIEADLRQNPSPALRVELEVISDEVDTLDYKINQYMKNV